MKKLLAVLCVTFVGVVTSAYGQVALSIAASTITPVNTSNGQVINQYGQFVLAPSFVNLAAFGGLSQYQSMTLTSANFTATNTSALTPGVYPVEIYGAKLNINGTITYTQYQTATQVDFGPAALTVSANGASDSGVGVGFLNLANGLRDGTVSVWVMSLQTAGSGYAINGSLNVIAVPEPSTWVLMATGLIAFLAYCQRRNCHLV